LNAAEGQEGMVRIPASVKAAIGLGPTRRSEQRWIRWLVRGSWLAGILLLELGMALAVAIPMILFASRMDHPKDVIKEPQALSADAADQGAAKHDQSAAKQQPENAFDPLVQGPVIRRTGEDEDNGPVGVDGLTSVTPFASPERVPSARMRAQAGRRRFFRGRRLFWRWGAHRVTGVARSGW
jgi:hypothetical protein